MTKMHLDFHHLTKDQGNIVNKIINAALAKVDPFQAVIDLIHINEEQLTICGNKYILSDFNRIILVGMGKAVGPMAAACIKMIGDKIDTGTLIAKHNLDKWAIPDKIEVYYGSHPIPSEKSIAGAEALLRCVANTTEKDLIICVISGGGSALASRPIDPINLTEMQDLTTLLLQSGAGIKEFNTVRKHLDEIKGGGIAKMAGNTPVETLILSDVLGDDISMIASGPTIADETTFEEAYKILQKYQLLEKVPKRILSVITTGIEGEDQKTNDRAFSHQSNKHNHIIGSLSKAIAAAEQTAKEIGMKTQVISTCIVGEAREVGKISGTILRSIATTDMVLPRPGVVIGGGETTVTIHGDGMGGRNQEIAFGAIKEINGLEDCAVIAIATDGEDGPTDAAGAYVTGYSLRRAENLRLQLEEFGANNNTYEFFDRMGDLIKTGPTGTNVNDLLFLFAF
jgi:glycerate 2-kinase